MAFCNNCGAQLDEGKNFCTRCGTKAGGASKVRLPKLNRKVLFAAAAVIVAAAAVVMVIGQGGDGKGSESLLVGLWSYETEHNYGDIEFLNDGSGITFDNAGIHEFSWRVQDEQLIVISEGQEQVVDYEIAGITLTITTGDRYRNTETYKKEENETPKPNVLSALVRKLLKGKSYTIGGTGPGGGIIFYYNAAGFINTLNGETCHYMEAAPADMSEKLAWASPNYETAISTKIGIGTGAANTEAILALDPNAPAAKACREYRGGNKSDWFLPSRNELGLMHGNLEQQLIGNIHSDLNWNWTSSSFDRYPEMAWYSSLFSANDGTASIFISTESKNEKTSVRPVRVF